MEASGGLPLVTVVTPSYNQAAYIEECIQSVRRQEYSHVEHIIMDGGSTDGSLDIIRRYEGSYNMKWFSEADSGMYHAINKGLKRAKGEIVAYLNTDDRYFPWTVRTAVTVFMKYPHIDFVFGDMMNINGQSTQGVIYFYPPFRLDFLQRTGFIGKPTVFLRRSVFERFGWFDESLKYVADCEFWMRIGNRCCPRRIDEIMAVERNHAEAKRFALAHELSQELRAVRSRYVPTCFRNRVLGVWDRGFAAFWRRIHVLRFLWACLRAQRVSSYDGPWANFLSSSFVHVNVSGALLTLMPFVGKRFARQMVSVSFEVLEQAGDIGGHE